MAEAGGRSAWTQPGGHITNGEEYIGEASQGDDVSGKRRRMRASHIKAERMPEVACSIFFRKL